MKQVIRKRIKALLVVLAIHVLIVSVLYYIIYSNIENLIVTELAKNAMNTAATTASFIERDIEPYRALSDVQVYDPGSYDEEYYESMLLVFQKLKKDTGASFIFTEKKIADDKIQYILDGEAPSSEEFSPIGTEDTMGETELRAFHEGRILATDMIRDPVWGDFLTGFAPIIDRADNHVVGLVGVDFSLDYVQTLIGHIKFLIAVCFYTIAAFSTFVIYIIMVQKYKNFERDQLTDLYSKRYFDQQIVRIMERSKWSKRPFSLAVIDIDDFKNINDTLGHVAGDEILRSVGKLMKKNLRYADLCFRYGGDELVLVLPDTEADSAKQICERIITAIGEHKFDIGGKIIHITMSIGLAQWDGRMDADQLVACADREMYLSKNAGKNRVSLHEQKKPS